MFKLLLLAGLMSLAGWSQEDLRADQEQRAWIGRLGGITGPSGMQDVNSSSRPFLFLEDAVLWTGGVEITTQNSKSSTGIFSGSVPSTLPLVPGAFALPAQDHALSFQGKSLDVETISLF